MFKVMADYNGFETIGYYIADKQYNYLHSDGSIFKTIEAWPTHKDAQTILDKFPNAKPPESPHEWEHGDVFKNDIGIIMMYHNFMLVVNQK